MKRRNPNAGLIQRFPNISLVGCMLPPMSTGAHAMDYSFFTESASDCYSSTSYEDACGLQYNYGGLNVVDYQIPELEYGSFSITLTGIMERAQLSRLQETTTTTSTSDGYGVGIETPVIVDTPGINEFPTYPQLAYTNADGMKYSDGSIGTLKALSLGINIKVRGGEINSSMRKGLGHYSFTSAWDGDVGVCGHNRGTKYVIGSIRDLEIDDTVTYAAVYGTHTYSVSMVKIIDSTDWNYLQATTDNRMMLAMCLASQPDKRICVQVAQING